VQGYTCAHSRGGEPARDVLHRVVAYRYENAGGVVRQIFEWDRRRWADESRRGCGMLGIPAGDGANRLAPFGEQPAERLRHPAGARDADCGQSINTHRPFFVHVRFGTRPARS
jgi:hypothetical protein